LAKGGCHPEQRQGFDGKEEYHAGEGQGGNERDVRYQVKEGSNYDDADRGNISGEGPNGYDQRGGKMGDRVFLPARKDAIDISRWPAALFLLQRLRDEAHRFAVSYHRKVKEKEDFNSLLDQVPGVGPEKRKALLKGLGDMVKIREATVPDLQKIKGIGKELATAIFTFFRKESGLP
jgi:excinuclease ABC subunit C